MRYVDPEKKACYDGTWASCNLLCLDADNEKRWLFPPLLRELSWFRESCEGKCEGPAWRKQGYLSSDGDSGRDLLTCRLSALPLTRGEKASLGKENGTNWVEKRKWHESTVFSKEIFLVAEGAPFLAGRFPITGRNHSYTGVHTYTSQGVCLCDSYTVIILDG